MEINEFIDNLSDLFEENTEELLPSTKIRDIKGWNSLVALSVIAMIDEEYGVLLKGNDIMEVETIQELFDSVEKKR